MSVIAPFTNTSLIDAKYRPVALIWSHIKIARNLLLYIFALDALWLNPGLLGDRVPFVKNMICIVSFFSTVITQARIGSDIFTPASFLKANNTHS
jgi:hypothetical protein